MFDDAHIESRLVSFVALFDDPYSAHGVDRLAAWGLLRGDRLPLASGGNEIEFEPETPAAVRFNAVIDAVTARALNGPTELTAEELATLVVRPPDPKRLLDAQRLLQKVGVTWPGSPEILEEPR